MKESGTLFHQSLHDFPCPVTLGKDTPSFGLHRFNQGLRFVPPADEGFTLRGDKRRLIYKGRRRSHRFTVLGDTAFEYDCILNRPPDTNVVTLLMVGAENFDFFRQPDFVRDPFLKGSYAVYKKETLLGEGTGKLCHIHRPEIIDARGRRCWGGLAVAGNELRITIPEKWLGEAVYPVIVDPTVGTSTAGSQRKFNFTFPDGRVHFSFYGSLGVNRFLLPETLKGTAKAFVYCFTKTNYGGCRPIIYSDNNNVPLSKLTADEEVIDTSVNHDTKREGWRSGGFTINTDIKSGSFIWFGVTAATLFPAYDYGAAFYYYTYENEKIYLPDTFPLYPDGRFYDCKFSAYFTYSANYVRTVTQGVKLSGKLKLKTGYKRNSKLTAGVKSSLLSYESFFRNLAETVKNTLTIGRLPVFFRSAAAVLGVADAKSENCDLSRECIDDAGVSSCTKRVHNGVRELRDGVTVGGLFSRLGRFYRNCVMNAGNSDSANRLLSFVRYCVMTAANTVRINRFPVFYRNMTEFINAKINKHETLSYSRNCTGNVNVNSETNRVHNATRKAAGVVNNSDGLTFPLLFVRSVPDTAIAGHKTRKKGSFIRGLAAAAGSVAETSHKGVYRRFQGDTVRAVGSVSGGYFVFVKIITRVFIRDYLLGRFLKVRENLILKSAVSREIIINSKIS